VTPLTVLSTALPVSSFATMTTIMSFASCVVRVTAPELVVENEPVAEPSMESPARQETAADWIASASMTQLAEADKAYDTAELLVVAETTS
jgi:hypothetical protein